jgi:hypothetical protein
LGHLLRLADHYKGRAAFLFVAIANPGHPSREAIDLIGEAYFPEDGTPEDHLRLTRRGLEAYKFPFPGLHDADGAVQYAYGAYPKRLLVVGRDGLVDFDGGRGKDLTYRPCAWDLEAFEEHLQAALRLGQSPGPDASPGAERERALGGRR